MQRYKIKGALYYKIFEKILFVKFKAIYCMQSVSTDKFNQDHSVDTWLFLLLQTYFDFIVLFTV